VYYQRFILGKWALAEGLIYPSFRDAIIADLSGIEGSPSDCALSIDYGTQNAFAALLWEKYGKVWICTDEYYHSGRDTGIQKTDGEYADDLDAFTKRIIDKRKKDAEENRTYFRKLKTIVDPSAASFITELNRRKNYSVIHANNNVSDGIQETHTCMKNGYIKILRSCKNTIAELNGYVWDDKAGDDRPIKENDHAMDSMRYFVHTYRLATPKRETYISPFRR
jgi:PBSX family phage terminase large subunit